MDVGERLTSNLLLKGMHRKPGIEAELIAGVREYAVCLYSAQDRVRPTTEDQVAAMRKVSNALSTESSALETPEFISIIEIWISKSSALAIVDAVWTTLRFSTVGVILQAEVAGGYSVISVQALPDGSPGETVLNQALG
jgi:hypothetical protein